MKNEENKEKKENPKLRLSGRIKKKIPIIAGIFLLVAVCGFSAVKVLAKVSINEQTKIGKANSGYLIGSANESEVGRYRLNMTGNVSYYTTWNPTWTDLGGLLDTLGDNAPSRDEILNYYSYPTGKKEDVIFQNTMSIKSYPYGNGAKQTYTTISYSGGGVKKNTTIFDPSKIKANSSNAKLELATGSSVYKAYLVWYVRDDDNELGFANKSVDLYYDGKNKKSVTADEAYIDVRESDMVTGFDENGKEIRNTIEVNSYLCLAADVTDYVKKHGAGTYGVANIPYWYQTEDIPYGGASIGAWQLVVVAENESWDVRAVAVKMGSTFMGTGSSGEYSESVKSSLKAEENASGQIFLSGLYGNNGVHTTVTATGDKSGDFPINSSDMSAGMINGNYPEGSSATAKSSFFSAVDEINNMGEGNTKYTLKVNKTTSWDTYFCLGMSVDVDTPDFVGIQQTTYNAADKTVTVTGTKTNNTENSDPKVYDGRLVVQLDSNLKDATNISFTVKNASGTQLQSGSGTYNASDNTVTFTGINSSTKGDVVSYSITCSLKSEGVLEVNNSDSFYGKVQYGSDKTGIEVPLNEASSGTEIMVHVTLDSQGAKIDGNGVTSEGTKEYYIRYGSGSFADSALSTQISAITIPTKKHCTFMGYYTAEDGGGTQCIDRNGTILDAGKAFTKDTTLYAYWSPAVFTITLDAQRSEGAITNASSRTKAIYSKYYVGLYGNAECTVPISSAVLPTSNGETCIGYWSVPGGSTMGANAAQYIESNGNLLQGAGTFDCKLITKNMTIYADWQSKNYTIYCDTNATVLSKGTEVFYETYGKYYTFDPNTANTAAMKTAEFSFNGSDGTAVGGTVKDNSGVNGSRQIFVAPYTGWYYFEVWGAHGGSGKGTAGGAGGYAAGWKYMAQGAVAYVYVGGRGGNTTKAADVKNAKGEVTKKWSDNGSEGKGSWNGSGGWNGGQAGAGYLNWWGVGGGGGSTDIRIGGKDKDLRVIAGGGGGGGASTTANAGTATTKEGGAGGGKWYWTFDTEDGKFTGKTNKVETNANEAKALNGKYYGDGGGHPGGASAAGSNTYIKTGQGGDNYNDGVVGLAGTPYKDLDSCKELKKKDQNGVRSGNGYAKIHYFDYSTTSAVRTASIYTPTREDYYFAGYYTAKDGGNQVVAANGSIVTSDTYFDDSNTVNGAATIYAHWSSTPITTYTIVYHANGGSGTVASQECSLGVKYNLNSNTFIPPYQKQSKILCWNTAADGSGTSYSAGQEVQDLAAAGSTIILYAQWEDANISYNVTLHEGTGIESVSGAGTYRVGQTVTISAAVKEGYHWLNWTGSFSADAQTYTFQMPEQDVDLTANAEANSYTIRFDPNGGTGHIDDIVAAYDTDVTLPDGAAAYMKYTMDGVNVTADVVSGVIPQEQVKKSWKPEENTEEETEEVLLEAEDTETGENKARDAKTGDAVAADEDTERMEFIRENTETVEDTEETTDTETDTETKTITEDTDATDEEGELESEEDVKAAHSLKAAYPSVFLGWALYDDKDKVTPTWKAGDVVRNLAAENNGVVTLYAVWDDCPWITATDLYYTLEQAQSGFITTDEILSHASAIDREDGSPILPGVNPAANNPAVNTSFTIPDYQASEFTSMTHDAAVSENLTVTDSAGSTYVKQIMVYVVDTTPQKVKPIGVTRFINEYYYNQPYEYGGLEDNSIWKTDPEYRSVLQEAFDNLKNGTPEETYYFTHETILEMKQYIQDHGVGNSEEPGALQQFYNQFMAPNRIN